MTRPTLLAALLASVILTAGCAGEGPSAAAPTVDKTSPAIMQTSRPSRSPAAPTGTTAAEPAPRARLDAAVQRLLQERNKGAYTVSLRNGASYEVLGFEAAYDLTDDAVAGEISIAGDFGERDVFAGAVVLAGDHLWLEGSSECWIDLDEVMDPVALASLRTVTYTPFDLLRELRAVSYNDVQQYVMARLPSHRALEILLAGREVRLPDTVRDSVPVRVTVVDGEVLGYELRGSELLDRATQLRGPASLGAGAQVLGSAHLTVEFTELDNQDRSLAPPPDERVTDRPADCAAGFA